MLPSTKSLIPFLADRLAIKPAAIYERQRELVRAGLMEQSPGRGPGSGVRATHRNLAMLLISVLTTSSLSEVNDEAGAIARLKNAKGTCPVTGKKMFADALVATLKTESLLKKVIDITVRRAGKDVSASIAFIGPQVHEPGFTKELNEVEVSNFGAAMARHHSLFYKDMSVGRSVETKIALKKVTDGILPFLGEGK
jgi:hypothetical protein